MLALGLAMSAAIGVALGLLGGGGSILTVPTLHYVFDLEPHAAIAASLAVVAITGAAALIPHARAGRVQWRIGLAFGAASMSGAFVAARVARYLPGTLLLVLLGGVMMVTAAAMLRGRRGCTPAPGARASIPAVAIQGLIVGAIAGMVGAGGGFLIVPALVVVTRLAMPQAIATSLLVIVLNSIAGFAGSCGAAPIDGRTIAIVAVTAVLGSIGGAALAGRTAPEQLRRLFGWFVVAMAVFVLGQEIPRALGHPIDLARSWPWLLAGLTLVLSTAAPWTLLRRAARAHPHGAPSDAVSPALRS